MQDYIFIVTSEDPNDGSEDAHQQYRITQSAESEDAARELIKEKFEEALQPIFWMALINKI